MSVGKLKYTPDNCCSRSFIGFTVDPSEHDGNEVVSLPITCRKMFCSKCYETKLARASKMLYGYKIYSRNLLHFSVGIEGIPLEDVRDVKKRIEGYLGKFHRKLRDNGYLFKAMRVFDLAYNFDKETYFVHFHYAVLPEKRWYPKYMYSRGKKFLNDTIESVSNGEIKLFVGHGKSFRNGLFTYFAKRMSGKFGHKDKGNNFFLEDVMTYEQSVNIFRYMRKLIVTPPGGARITCIMGNVSIKISFPDNEKTVKPECKIEFSGIQLIHSGKKPPPDAWKTKELFYHWLVRQDCDSYVAITRDGRELLEQINTSNWSEEIFSKGDTMSDQEWLTAFMDGGWSEDMNPQEPLTTIHEEMRADACL